MRATHDQLSSDHVARQKEIDELRQNAEQIKTEKATLESTVAEKEEAVKSLEAKVRTNGYKLNLKSSAQGLFHCFRRFPT